MPIPDPVQDQLPPSPGERPGRRGQLLRSLRLRVTVVALLTALPLMALRTQTGPGRPSGL